MGRHERHLRHHIAKLGLIVVGTPPPACFVAIADHMRTEPNSGEVLTQPQRPWSPPDC